MKKYRLTIDGETYDVIVKDVNQNPIEVTVNGKSILVVPADLAPDAPAPLPEPSRSVQTDRPAQPSTQTDNSAVFAPIPGVVNAISVSPGDSVTVGQELLVLEAMKMNNIIRSPRDGVVSAIHVHLGEQVQHNTMLVEFTKGQGE